MQNAAQPSEHPAYRASGQFVVRTIAGETLLIPVGAATQDFNGMILLNETGAFLWEALQEPKTEDALTAALVDAFETDPETALSDIRKFINHGIQNNLISCIE